MGIEFLILFCIRLHDLKDLKSLEFDLDSLGEGSSVLGDFRACVII